MLAQFSCGFTTSGCRKFGQPHLSVTTGCHYMSVSSKWKEFTLKNVRCMTRMEG